MKVIIQIGLLVLYMAFAINCQDKNSASSYEISITKNPTDTISGSTGDQVIQDESSDPTVYVCESTGAKRYHYSLNCRGLKHCTHDIVQKKRKEAERFGLTLCGYEAKD